MGPDVYFADVTNEESIGAAVSRAVEPWADGRRHRRGASGFAEGLTASRSIGHLGTTQDITNSVLWLASDEPVFATGAFERHRWRGSSPIEALSGPGF